MDIEKIAEMLKTHTVDKLAEKLGMPTHTLFYQINMAGLSVLQIKRDYAIERIKNLMWHGMTCAKMAEETGFCLGKVKKYRKMIADERL